MWPRSDPAERRPPSPDRGVTLLKPGTESSSPQGSRRDLRGAACILGRYGHPHLRWLVLGMLGSIGVVACRLAIPWPLRWALEFAPWPQTSAAPLPHWLSADDPLLLVSMLYMLFAAALGCFEMLQRTNIRRHVALTVQDLRAAAVRGVSRSSLRRRVPLGDLTARIIGDSARLKADVSGILIHATTNGLLFVAVCGVMLWVSAALGFVFLASGLLAIFIALRTSHTVADIAFRQRVREGQYASTLQLGLEAGGDALDQLEPINQASTYKDVRATTLISRSSLLVHLVLATAVCAGIWFGAQQARAGDMEQGDLFLFIIYALTVHRRVVQGCRQIARTGKVIACANRLGLLVEEEVLEERPLDPGDAEALPVRLHLEKVKLLAARSKRRRPRLREVHLDISPGSRVAVLGRPGSGKSSLLQLIAGREPDYKGRFYGSADPLGNEDLAPRGDYLAEEPILARQHIWEILGFASREELSPTDEETLKSVGAWEVIRGFSRGLDAKMSSFELTRNEARAIALSRILLSGRTSLWILDCALEGLSRKRARRRLDEIWKRALNRTIVISMSHPCDLSRFDRVVRMRRGRIEFDGRPSGWRRRRKSSDSGRRSVFEGGNEG